MFLQFVVLAFFSRKRQKTLETMRNEELLLEFNNGRADAFALILNRIEKPLFIYILRRVQNEESARDILQDTFMKLSQHAHRYDEKTPLLAWMYTIARHRCIDFLRKKRLPTVSLDSSLGQDEGFTFHHLLSDKSPGSLEQLSAKEFMHRLDSALNEINVDQREIFILRELHGLKFIEIAETLDLSENTVKSRMRYALDALRKQLSDFVPHIDAQTELRKEESR